MQEALVTLLVAVALRDPETVARVLYRIGVPDAHTPITALRDDISAILDRYLGLKLDQIRTSTLLHRPARPGGAPQDQGARRSTRSSARRR